MRRARSSIYGDASKLGQTALGLFATLIYRLGGRLIWLRTAPFWRDASMLMTYDLIVIGTGPRRLCLRDPRGAAGPEDRRRRKATRPIGGTCLNVGCIPSKALLHASHMFDEAAHGLAPLGVIVDPPRLDLPAMMKHKDETVAANVNGVAFLFKKNKIDGFRGVGRHRRRRQGRSDGADGADANAGDQEHRHRHRLRRRAAARRLGRRNRRSTKRSFSPPPARWRWRRSRNASSSSAPASSASNSARCGGGSARRSTVIEYLDRMLPGFDLEVATRFQKILEKQGFVFQPRLQGDGRRAAKATARAFPTRPSMARPRTRSKPTRC